MADDMMMTMAEVDTTPRLILEVLTSSLAGRRFAFTSTDLAAGVKLGRAAECQVRFDPARDLKVSGKHALLEERNGRVYIRDLGSSNGLFFNNARVTSEGMPVSNGGKIALGQEGAILQATLPGEPMATMVESMPAGGMAAAAAHASPSPQPVMGDHGPPPGSGSRDSLVRVVDDLGQKVGAGDKTKYMIKEVASHLESRAAQKRGALSTLIGALVLLLLAAGAMAGWYVWKEGEEEKQAKTEQDEKDRVAAEKEKERDERDAELDKELDKFRKEMEAIRDAWADQAKKFEDLEKKQDERLAELKKELDEETAAAIAKATEEATADATEKLKEELKKDLDALEDERRKEIAEAIEKAKAEGHEVEVPSEKLFQEWVEKYNESVFLVYVSYPLLNDKGEAVGVESGTGTGWLAKRNDQVGYIVTNKHVVKPYLFKHDLAISHAIQNVHPDPDFKNWVIAVWHAGTHLRDEIGSSMLNVSEAWGTIPGNRRGGRGHLRIKGFADDRKYTFGDNAENWLTQFGFRTDLPEDMMGRVREIAIHEMDTPNDLCVIEIDRLDLKTLHTPLPIATDDELEHLRQLDPVMALGYPLGLSVIKGTIVTTSPATGVIRNLQTEIKAIGISAPIMPGNSGGPLINKEGKVIGITTRGFEATLAEAISADEARKLLENLLK